MARHVDRTQRMGQWVLISEGPYKSDAVLTILDALDRIYNAGNGATEKRLRIA